MVKKVYTIGYASFFTVGPGGLAAYLIGENIGTLVDIRRFPEPKNGVFTAAKISKACRKYGIKYVPAPFLGPPSSVLSEARRRMDFGYLVFGYKIYLEKIAPKVIGFFGELERSITKESASDDRPGEICLMCAEKRPTRCHRSILADFLSEKMGRKPIHLPIGLK